MPVSTEPLLLEEESANGHASRRQTPLWRHFAVAGCLVAYVLLGAIERVSFARMASAMSTGVVLMHTLLCVCTLLLFVLLQLARNQSGPPISEQLERLHMGDVLSMTLLDVLHTLLALAGATLIPGVVQALLLQGTVPAITLFSALLTNGSGSGGGSSRSRSSDSSGGGSDHGSSADSNSGGGGGSGGGRDGSGGSKNRQQTLTLWQWLNHLINHSSLSQCMCQLASSPTCYQLVASIAIAATVISVALTPPLSAAPAPTPLRALKWPDLAAIAIGATSTEAAPADGSLAPDGPTSANTAGDAMLGRRLFLASTALSALASVHKRRCLERRPVDLLVLNTCLSAVQLMVGLVIAPPLLMVLASRPIRDTLVQLARGLRCCMSGFNPNICAADNSDAFGVRRHITSPLPCAPLPRCAPASHSGCSHGMPRSTALDALPPAHAQTPMGACARPLADCACDASSVAHRRPICSRSSSLRRLGTLHPLRSCAWEARPSLPSDPLSSCPRRSSPSADRRHCRTRGRRHPSRSQAATQSSPRAWSPRS